ncbi:hypothetical protein J2D73_12425 [Acetobacter sacchari]|uniref:Uncharacterized protein n=1 Tax=Acetobacter sacchari TaxID=2661687 RepID=A0ABS3LXG2_9PROT|nr:hypothetical protein [Acetobacter sacchari]MBO1360594.1 hypothetical protein [Acetobacter sacchari]
MSDTANKVPQFSAMRDALKGRRRNLTSRPLHVDSDDEDSDSDDPLVFYRALRPDETNNVYVTGLSPIAYKEQTSRKGVSTVTPIPEDPGVTQYQHVRHSSKAAKSQYISASRSKKLACAWAVSGGQTGHIARIELDEADYDGKVFDLTDTSVRDALGFESGNDRSSGPTATSFATSSQEVLIKGVVPPESLTLIKVTRVDRKSAEGASSYEQAGASNRFTTRSKKTESGKKTSPYSMVLKTVKNQKKRDRESVETSAGFVEFEEIPNNKRRREADAAL